MNDAGLGQRVSRLIAARDRAVPAPPFASVWRAAVSGTAVRGAASHQASRRVGLESLVAAVGVAAVALIAVWRLADLDAGAAGLRDAADLRLARRLAPEHHWVARTDTLLSPYRYEPPSPIDIPTIENPFEESLP